jgi:hypothetical protein
MAASGDRLLSFVYLSTATKPFGDDDLAELLAKSRENNGPLRLTGVLLHRRGRFLQVLEGPEDAVRDRMSIITSDPRHTGVRILLEETLARRKFPDWTMEYQPFAANVVETIPGYRTFFPDADDAVADPSQELSALHALMRWFESRASQSW